MNYPKATRTLTKHLPIEWWNSINPTCRYQRHTKVSRFPKDVKQQEYRQKHGFWTNCSKECCSKDGSYLNNL